MLDTIARTKTEEKAKVVAAAYGAESINFFASLAILHQDNLKNKMNSSRRCGGLVVRVLAPGSILSPRPRAPHSVV